MNESSGPTSPGVGSSVPTRVVLYKTITEEFGKSIPIAEFRYDPNRGVTLTLLDENWSMVPRRIYEKGMRSRIQERKVSPNEGPAFMWALLEPLHATYYKFIDKSNEDA
ncbi:MAG: hypothetical protein ACRDT4_18500 [Micromonosporaceae bacterium]